MCGIFGQCRCVARADANSACANASASRLYNSDEKVDALLSGLAALQYRGYDSCGVAWIECGSVRRYRAVGAIEALQARLADVDVAQRCANDDCKDKQHDDSWCAIAHTRWATHGKVVEENTHPHVACGYALVHNGVVDNADALRAHLTQQCGVELSSETDTELIAHLLAQQPLDIALEKRIANAMLHVHGANAIAVISTHDPHLVALWRRGSPLAIGFNSDAQHPQFIAQKAPSADVPACDPSADSVCGLQFTFASDLSALQPYAQRAVLLGDDEIAVLCARSGTCRVFYSGSRPSASVQALSRVSAAAESGTDSDAMGNSGTSVASIHIDRNDGLCMWREIHEQPASLKRALAGRLYRHADGHHDVHLGGLAQYWQQLATAQRLVMIACGTSYYAALAARAVFEQCCGKRVLVERATPLLDRQMPIFRGDACFFLSQSGETADVLAAMQHCRNAGALCVGVVNAVASSIARLTDCGIYLKCGPEIAVASTKAFTSQISVLALVAAHLAPNAQQEQLLCALANASAAVASALSLSDSWAQHWASRWRDKQRCLVLARGADEATAYEAALKIKELCYVLAEGCHAGELKHGPLALIDADLPVIAIASEDKESVVAQRMRVALEQVRARNGAPIVVSNSADANAHGESSDRCRLTLPSIGDERLQCIVNIIPLQLLSFYWAKERGLNVDRPRNLAKSVTVQ